jgi:hypothetical protein
MKNKTLIITLSVISGLVLILLLIGLTNKTYFKKHYVVTNKEGDKVNIPVPLFSFYNGVEGKYNVTFSTLRSVKATQNVLNKYVENLQSCYDESYFYDKNLNITISKYQVEKGSLFNKISLSYTYGNYCKNQYVLDKDWINTFKEKAKVSETVIDRCITINSELKCDNKKISNYGALELINNTLNFERIENKNNFGIDESRDYYSISVYYTIDKQGYTLSIFKYGDALAFKVVDANDHPKNAIYNINQDVDKVLKDLYNK